MKPIIRIIFGLAIILPLAAMSLTGCGNETGASDLESFSTDHQNEKATNVEVVEIQPASFTEYIEVPGEVKADIASTISAEESGRVSRIYYSRGARVKKGAVLIELDSEVLRKMYKEARAAYESARIRFERQKNLYQQKAVSEQQFLDTKFTFQRAEAALAALRARLKKMKIRSPIDGILDNRYVDIGEFVAPGTPVAEVIKIDTVRVEAGVPERYAVDIGPGSKVQVRIDVLGDRRVDGNISFIGSTINPTNRTFPLEVIIPNPEGLIKPNMLARLYIVRRQYENAIVIPRDVIIEHETGSLVFVADGQTAKARRVEIVASSGNEVLVRGDLRFGDRLIIRGHRDLIDGEYIAVQND